MKRQRRKENQMKLPQGSKLWAVSIAAAFLASVAVFGVMLRIEQNTLTKYEKGKIFLAAGEIPKGQKITAENYEAFFEERELDKSCIPRTALQTPEQITELVSAFDIEKGVLLTTGMFEELDKVKSQMKMPVIAGFKAEDLHQVVGGVLRVGDRIHIYAVREDGDTSLVWKDAFVEQVFDASGNVIQSGDRITAAQRINIYLEEADVEAFYAELAGGSLRVVKVFD